MRVRASAPSCTSRLHAGRFGGEALAESVCSDRRNLAAERLARAAAAAAAFLLACDASAQGRFGRFGDADVTRTERRIDCSASRVGEAALEAQDENSGAAAAAPAGERAAEAAASVPICRVDVSTYVGWRVFHSFCATCHAADATGSTYAPDLTFRMRGMDRRAFFAALDDGYLGPDAGLPPHGENPDVARYYEELWAYLSARVSGELPARPLEPLPPVAE